MGEGTSSCVAAFARAVGSGGKSVANVSPAVLGGTPGSSSVAASSSAAAFGLGEGASSCVAAAGSGEGASAGSGLAAVSSCVAGGGVRSCVMPCLSSCCRTVRLTPYWWIKCASVKLKWPKLVRSVEPE